MHAASEHTSSRPPPRRADSASANLRALPGSLGGAGLEASEIKLHLHNLHGLGLPPDTSVVFLPSRRVRARLFRRVGGHLLVQIDLSLGLAPEVAEGCLRC